MSLLNRFKFIIAFILASYAVGQGKPFYVTEDGKVNPVKEIFA
jgi:hypothetical protein